jgi:hypothetical protein
VSTPSSSSVPAAGSGGPALATGDRVEVIEAFGIFGPELPGRMGTVRPDQDQAPDRLYVDLDESPYGGAHGWRDCYADTWRSA